MPLRDMRFTIRRLMAAVVLVAIFLWLMRRADGVPFAVALGGLVLAFACWASVRGRRRRAAICFLASVVTANALEAPLSLIIDPNPSGRSGFVRYLPGNTSGSGCGPFHNLFMGMSMSRRWTFEVED